MSGKGAFAYRHAFKVLCPDAMIVSILGPKGVTKDQWQEECGSKIVVSNREEYYPNTRLRILCIYADQVTSINATLEKIVQIIGMLGDKERSEGSHGGEVEYLGKEQGEYLLRCAIPLKVSGAIIGPKGANIQALREEFRARVFIDNTSEYGHQTLKLVASLENMAATAARINDSVQTECTTEAFKEWAAMRSFGPGGGGGGDDHLSKGGKGGGKDPQKGGGRHHSRSPRRQSRGSPLEALAETLGSFPDGALEDKDFALVCDLPRVKVSALIGKSGEHVRHVRKLTNTQVHFEEAPGQETQAMTITGRLTDVYRAHALMMRRYHEDEEEHQEKQEKKLVVADLQAQLAELQQKLSLATGNAPPSSKGGGKGSGKRR